MTAPKIAINGFGRIGRMVTRIAKQNKHFDVVAVNDLASAKELAYTFKYDSVHGRYNGTVTVEGNRMTIDGDPFEVLSEKDPEKLPWAELGVDYVIEATGRFRRIEELEHHLEAGAKRVIITVPTKDYLESTVVLGVNDHVIEGAKIISNASCTTNCAAPMVSVLQEHFGIKRGLLTTVHAYTSSQSLVDAADAKNPRRARHAAINIIPTTTGAAKAVERVIPEVTGKLDGMAMRVPVPDGSVVDMVVELEQDVTIEAVNNAMIDAAANRLAGIMSIAEDPIVSTDIVGDRHSCIFDPFLTQVLQGRMVKVIGWYDNEFGYSARVEDLISRLAVKDGLTPT
ncbi:MAG: type I glyceraldehyde-3-phosphate dehydrogenase, partial [Acidobacteriota bacterium]